MGIQELVVEDGYICWPATSAAEVLSLHAKNLRSLVLYFGHPQSHFDAYGKHLGSSESHHATSLLLQDSCG